MSKKQNKDSYIAGCSKLLQKYEFMRNVLEAQQYPQSRELLGLIVKTAGSRSPFPLLKDELIGLPQEDREEISAFIYDKFILICKMKIAQLNEKIKIRGLELEAEKRAELPRTKKGVINEGLL